MIGSITLVCKFLDFYDSTVTVETVSPKKERLDLVVPESIRIFDDQDVPYFLRSNILAIHAHLESGNRIVCDKIKVLYSPESQKIKEAKVQEGLSHLEVLSFRDLDCLLTELFYSFKEIPAPVYNSVQREMRRITLKRMQQVLDHMNERLEVK